MHIEVILAILIISLILGMGYAYYYRQRRLFEMFNDTPPIQQSQQQSQSQQQPQSELATNPDYKAFYAWHRDFCNTWNKVIKQSMESDNTKLTITDYIVKLESKANTQFVKCDPLITEDPDPIKVLTIIPDTIDQYATTLTYMSRSITTILEKTKRALKGEKIVDDTDNTDGFQDLPICPPPTCISASDPAAAALIDARKNAIRDIIAKVQKIVPNIEPLRGVLKIVNQGIEELQTYKKKAESGELVNEINIP